MPAEITAHLAELMTQYFPDWQIVEKLGEGSYAQVYRIKRNSSEETAALKWITYTEADAIAAMQSRGVSPDAIRNYCRHTQRLLENEIKAMDKLSDCPNIVCMNEHHTIENDDGSFDMLIRMEMLTPLPRRIPGMRVKDVLAMGKDICSALSACELEHIVHRDIKPENIFYDTAGRYKLGDFGVAISLYGDRKARTQRGTPLYMAPEVYEGKQYDARVDICSLGLVLYECLNRCLLPFMEADGEPITPEKENDALEKRISDEEIEPPVQADSALAAVILKACSYEAEDRYQSAGEMLDDLNALGEKPEYENRLIPYTSKSSKQEVSQPAAGDTQKGLPRHTLNLSQRVGPGSDGPSAGKKDDPDDLPEEDEIAAQERREQERRERIRQEEERKRQEEAEKKKALKKKIITYGGLALAAGLLILFIVLNGIKGASYTNLKAVQNGLDCTVTWDNGGSGPWDFRLTAGSNTLIQVTAKDRKVVFPLAPDGIYTADVDGKISKEFRVEEKPAYSGSLALQWLRLCTYIAQPDRELRDQSVAECKSIKADPLSGQPGQSGYLLKGCAELPAGTSAEITCFLISSSGMETETFTVEGTDDGFRYFYIDLNGFIRGKCLNCDNVTFKLYSDGMLLFSKSSEIGE